MCVTENYFSHFSTKTYVVGTQKNRLNETVLLSTQNICSDCWVRKYLEFYAKNVDLTEPLKGYSLSLQSYSVHGAAISSPGYQAANNDIPYLP